MSIKLDAVGKKTAPIKHKYAWKDVVLYALGVGAKADELDFLFELAGPKVLPTFAVVPSFGALLSVTEALGADLAMIVHGEQKAILHRPIPPSGELSTVAEIKGIYDKGKGAVALVEAKTVDEKNEPVFDNWFTVFVRGAGGFGGDRGPEPIKADPPEGKAPDFTVSEATTPEQALLYRLSGDLNPLHASPEFAKRGGFDRPILHGLCTYGHAGRAVLKHACGGDPARLRSFAARFAGVVFPGETLTTMGWKVDPGKWVIQTKTQDGRLVLSNALAETGETLR
ncbi:MAG: MaoC family dehydratase N-terminal domain-containing protein [Deltaproteobacteria bacterium]|nr:MaoC family dehydratase N-terminal domain-containing protein [Deltaproteobacteria bacterium]